MNHITSHITLRELELKVHLGWPQAERSRTQIVVVDINIHFANAPTACVSDKLEDTYCYDTLVQKIREALGEKPFHLLEHLGLELYQMIKKTVSAETRISLRIKKRPPIAGLQGGVVFYYGDDPNTW